MLIIVVVLMVPAIESLSLCPLFSYKKGRFFVNIAIIYLNNVCVSIFYSTSISLSLTHTHTYKFNGSKRNSFLKLESEFFSSPFACYLCAVKGHVWVFLKWEKILKFSPFQRIFPPRILKWGAEIAHKNFSFENFQNFSVEEN